MVFSSQQHGNSAELQVEGAKSALAPRRSKLSSSDSSKASPYDDSLACAQLRRGTAHSCLARNPTATAADVPCEWVVGQFAGFELFRPQ